MSAGSSTRRRPGLLGAYDGSGSLKFQQADLQADFEALRDKQKAYSSRRSKLQLEVADAHATITDLVPLLALAESFSIPQLTHSTDDQWWAATAPSLRATLAAAGVVPDRRPTIPDPLGEGEAQRVAAVALAGEGLLEPTHPCRKRNISSTGEVSAALLRGYVERQMRSTTGWITRSVRRSRYRSHVDVAVANELAHLSIEMDVWEREIVAYRRALTARASELVEQRNRDREASLAACRREDESVEVAGAELRSRRAAAVKTVRSAYEAFRAGDPVVTTIVLQSCFADNGGTAAPLGIDNGDLLVVMAFPPASKMVWPEEGQYGGTVKKRTKAMLLEQYEISMRALVLATAREAFAVQPQLRRVRVIALDAEARESAASLASTRALLDVTFGRDSIPRLPQSLTAHRLKLMLVLKKWWASQEAGTEDAITWALSEWQKISYETIDVIHDTRRMLDDAGFISYFNQPASARPTIGSLLSDQGGNSSTVDAPLDDVEGADLDELWPAPDEMDPLVFWSFVALLRDNWDVDDVEADEIKSMAVDLASLIGPSVGGMSKATVAVPTAQPQRRSREAGQRRGQVDVVLVDAGPNKISIIKAIRELTSLGLREAKDIVDDVPSIVLSNVTSDTAANAKATLVNLGARVAMR